MHSQDNRLVLDGFICIPVSGFKAPCNLKGLICLFVKSCANFAVNNKSSIVKKASMMANKLKSGKQLRWRLLMILRWWLGSLEFVMKFKYYLIFRAYGYVPGNLLTIEINAGQCYVKSLDTRTYTLIEKTRCMGSPLSKLIETIDFLVLCVLCRFNLAKFFLPG